MKIEILTLRAVDGGESVLVTLDVSQDRPQADDGEGTFSEKVPIQRLCYRLFPEHVRSMRLHRGEIDEEQLPAIEQASQFCEAVRAGCRMLSYGNQSRRNLSRKLRVKGFPGDVCEAAAEYLCKQGYIDEEDGAMRFYERCLAKGWGPRRIVAGLYEKGYPPDSVRSVEAAMAEVDFAPACLAAMRRRCRTLPGECAERRKLAAAMVRQGYGQSEIRRAMELFCADEACEADDKDNTDDRGDACRLDATGD